MTKRLFIAVEISAEARAAAADLMNQLETDFPTAKVKWERPEKLHLTLRFLGTVEAGQVGSIQNAARNTAARCSPFNIELFGTGAFPNVKRPRVIWIGPVSWVANEIVIFESTLLPSGSVYSPIYRIPLLLS